MSAIERLESRVRSYSRTFPAVFARARGSLLFDAEGRRYIDFFSGAGALNYGHNDPAMKAAVIEYLESDGVVHGLDLATCAKEAFLERFEAVVLRPRGLDYKVQFVGPTGANGVEAALKLARLVTGRRTLVAFTNSYHGLSAGALAVTASRYHRHEAFGLGAPVVFLPFDGFLGPDVDTMAYARQMVLGRGGGIDPPAAVVVETIQAEGGVNVARPEWLLELERLCRDCGALLIVDDIQVGCGRAGAFFSFERAGIRPDLVVLSKSISGFGLPMALVLLRPELDQWQPGQHAGTFRGNNLAFVTAAEALRRWETAEFAHSIERKGRRVAERLHAIRERHPELRARVRGLGLIHGLELADAPVCQAVTREAFARGLILERCSPDGNVLKLLPPLVIEDPLLEEGLDRVEEAVAAAATPGAAPRP
ncbi:MAG TPA: diaminobutyrate--2-oxoglutarate transaminase [Isosphaeraceae bacterium]